MNQLNLDDHGTIVIENRTVTKGGNVINVGLRNITPDLLERLFVQGYLKAIWEPRSAADRRVCNGRAFQELYQMFKSQGKDPAAASNSYAVPVTLEGHVGSERDIAETVYFRTLYLLGKHSQVIRCVCIEGWMLGMKDTNLRKALDELPRAMETAKQDVLKRLGKI
jgi:hypothetical protein